MADNSLMMVCRNLYSILNGKHTIELEAVLRKMAELLQTINASNDRLNDYYRKILMITGTDLMSTLAMNCKLIPAVLRGMRQEAQLLAKYQHFLKR